MENIKILSDSMKSEELYDLLKEVMPISDRINLKLEQEPEKTMALDPVVLTLIITSGVTVLTTIITGLFGVWQKKIEHQGIAKQAVVKIKLKDGNEYEFPNTLTDKEINEKIVMLEGREIKRIALITEV